MFNNLFSVVDLKTTLGHWFYIFCPIYMNFDISHSTVYEVSKLAQNLRLSISVEIWALNRSHIDQQNDVLHNAVRYFFIVFMFNIL